MKEILLSVRGLTFSYEEGKTVLDDISVDIGKREKVAVLGANGAGKSTFFLHLNGVREPASGDIFLHGEKIGKKTRNRLRRAVGIVFQDADSQMIASTVKAEVAFGPLNMGLAVDEAESRTMDALKRMNLQEYAERPPHYLSGGEKKRVSIADIIAMESEIIIFDEPTAALDPVHAKMLEQILAELWQEGRTILLSTHDVDFAYRFAERILIFKDGKLIADGNTKEIFARQDILDAANLKKPMLMEFYELLREKELIAGEMMYPKTLEELALLLKQPERIKMKEC